MRLDMWIPESPPHCCSSERHRACPPEVLHTCSSHSILQITSGCAQKHVPKLMFSFRPGWKSPATRLSGRAQNLGSADMKCPWGGVTCPTSRKPVYLLVFSVSQHSQVTVFVKVLCHLLFLNRFVSCRVLTSTQQNEPLGSRESKRRPSSRRTAQQP